MMQQGITAKKKPKRKQNGKLRESIRGQIDQIRRSASTEFLSSIPRGSVILPYGTWRKTRYVTHQVDGTSTPSVVNAIKYTFKWRHGGRKIYLSGSFANNWSEFLEMSPYSSSNNDSNEPRQRKLQDIELYLPPGDHEYCFIVDGLRVHDPDHPFKLSADDQPTNILSLAVSDVNIPASAIVNVAQTMQSELDAERKKEKFYYQMQSAFMNTGAQILGLSLLVLIYLNYVMLSIYLTPIFWALMFGIILRNPKQQIIQYLEPIRQIEKSFYYRKRRGARLSFMSDGTLPVDIEIPEFGTLWDLTKAKAKFILTHTIHPFTREHFNFYILLIVLMSGLYGVYFGVWFRNAWLFTVPLGIFLVTIISLIVLDSSWHDVIIASLLIALGVVTFMCFTHFFFVTTVHESYDMYTRVQSFVENKLNETSPLDAYFQQQNITQDLVRTYLNSSKSLLDDWLTRHNLDTFQIQALVSAWNSNTTAIASTPGNFPGFSGMLINWDAHTAHQAIEWAQQQDFDFSAYASVISNLFIGTGISVLTSVIIMVSAFKDLVLGFTVFLACLYYLLVSKEFFLDKLVEIIPVEDTHKISIALRRSVNGIFLSSLAICGSHALVTFVFFTLCGLEFKFIATFFTAFIAIFPVLSSWLICIPVFLLLYISGSPYAMMQSLIFLILRLILLFVSDPYIFTKIPNSHPYITGLSMVSGIYTFGTEGILIGPMLVILTYTVFDILDQYRNSSYEAQH
mmetsp:Transcript_11612/g.16111  ORF Transcript_11612/g.16111 Transcript_11612/m.16111 type:complete len:738 (-) Transcript_11612:47-2260(-)